MLESVLCAENKGALKDLNSTSLCLRCFQSNVIAELLDAYTIEPLVLFTLDAQCDDGTTSTLVPSLHGLHYELTEMDELVKKKTEDCAVMSTTSWRMCWIREQLILLREMKV